MKLKHFPFYLSHQIQLFWLKLRQGSALPKIHVVGDSHASFCFTNVIPVGVKREHSVYTLPLPDQSSGKGFRKLACCIHWMGPMTMFRVGRDQLRAVHLRQMGVREKDITVFVFGEIDVRCHIEKQSQLQNRSMEAVVEDLIKAYLAAILRNKALFKQLQCVVCTVVPPTDKAFNVKFPFYGALDTRISLTKHLNAVLRQQCAAYGLPVLDLYTPHCTAHGDLRYECSDGGVHIASHFNGPIKAKLINLLASTSMMC